MCVRKRSVRRVVDRPATLIRKLWRETIIVAGSNTNLVLDNPSKSNFIKAFSPGSSRLRDSQSRAELLSLCDRLKPLVLGYIDAAHCGWRRKGAVTKRELKFVINCKNGRAGNDDRGVCGGS
jgi:hypothetical protein